MCRVSVAARELAVQPGSTARIVLATGSYAVHTVLTGSSAGRWLPSERTDRVAIPVNSAAAVRLTAAFQLAATLHVSVYPADRRADIYLDGIRIAAQVEAISLPVSAGEHRVEARNVADGYAVSQATTTFGGWVRHLRLDVSAPPDPLVLRSSYSWRFGVGVPESTAQAVWVARLGAGWWYDWRTRPNVGGTLGEYWQTIRLWNCALNPPEQVFAAEARRRPGQTWIVGNEPDAAEQDNVTPECLADLYHQAHAALKAADPTARVAVGGVVEGTPLRLKYLDRALAHYRSQFGSPLAADIWTMHAYILREERGSWGAGIPTGLDDTAGWLVQPNDHDNADLFSQQVEAFRQWMADNGYRDRPLVITEYGILLPADLGFTADRVRDFMLKSFDYLVEASDPKLGLPSDGDRLVQRWAWFSLAYDPFPTGNLFDAGRVGLTPLGQSYRDYVFQLK